MNKIFKHLFPGIPDEYKFCFDCGKSGSLTKSHFLKKNSIKAPVTYIYNERDNYCMMCLECHMKYEQLNPTGRLEFWRAKSNSEKEEYRDKCKKIYKRIKYLLGYISEVTVW